jgi:hypothetical protein
VTLREWLEGREPAPPPALAQRILELVAASDSGGQPKDFAEVCVASAERALKDLLASGVVSRSSALDLLAIDALITYAFEAASDEPSRVSELASDALIRLSRLAPTA